MIRLANSEKSMRLYQQKLVDALNSTDPLKKEADDLKNKLMIEMRERNRFECEAEVSVNMKNNFYGLLTNLIFRVTKRPAFNCKRS